MSSGPGASGLRPDRVGSSDRGSVTVFVVNAVAVVLFTGLAVASVSSLVTAHRRAQSAADLAALAGAGAIGRSADPCGIAGAVAISNSASLDSCDISAATVTVWVSVVGPELIGHPVRLRAVARAGR